MNSCAATTREDAHAQVRALLTQMRMVACGNAVMHKKLEEISDSIEVLTRAYMEPGIESFWLSCGLTETQRRIIAHLAQTPGRVVRKRQIHDALYFDRIDAPEPKLVDVMICKIRQQLKKFNAPYRIETVWGTGYRLLETEKAFDQPNPAPGADALAEHHRAMKALEAA
jgi:DNA-binding response OmpR family regulator